VPIGLTAQQGEHFPSNFVHIDQLAFGRRTLLIQRPQVIDDLGGTVLPPVYHSRDRLARFFNLRWVALQPSQTGACICHRGSNGLLDVVGQRGCKFSHHAHIGRWCERARPSQLAKSLALWPLGALSLRHITMVPMTSAVSPESSVTRYEMAVNVLIPGFRFPKERLETLFSDDEPQSVSN